ncbi:hypothetical protein [Paenibacillus elgii]|uniref:hypothetical protein n=1 Tax=Paenibacillus elgii TaxID=189691 RepID=UPI00203BE1EE|nr:hypothetical protein [Paenibacillus elgii]MCM3274284.1 hypothetical protein [Paenibacillus elgii]
MRSGETPYLNEIEVDEGLFKWSPEQNKYISVVKREQKEENNSRVRNSVAQIIQTIGYIMIFAGLVLGIISCFSANIVTGITFIASGVFSGMILIGFSEIIHLLDVISKK